MSSATAFPVAEAVARLRQLDDVDVAFSGRLDRLRGTFVLGEVHGARATSLPGLVSPVGAGVGGKCLLLQRPVSVSDYVRARGITHQFDHAVRQEGLRAVLAVPFRIDGEVSGVVYGASRRPIPFGERFEKVAMSIVRRAERTLAAQAATERIATEAERFDPGDAMPAGGHRAQAQLRELHAELRAIAATVAEQAVQDRLYRICSGLGGGDPHVPNPAVRLSPREIDVLAQVAVGCSNAEAARRLSLQVDTVKSYLKSAMSKLGSHNRGEAVFVAQRAGLLP